MVPGPGILLFCINQPEGTSVVILSNPSAGGVQPGVGLGNGHAPAVTVTLSTVQPEPDTLQSLAIRNRSLTVSPASDAGRSAMVVTKPLEFPVHA